MSATVCPSCGSRYRAGFTRCDACGVDLVDEAAFAEIEKKRASPRAALQGQKLVAIVHAGIAACREIERALLDDDIPCYVGAEQDDGEQPLSVGGAMKVGVMLAEVDVPRAAEVLRRRFQELIEKEGAGSLNSDAIDLSQSEVTCPACNHTGALAEGACADCGLFLGAPA